MPLSTFHSDSQLTAVLSAQADEVLECQLREVFGYSEVEKMKSGLSRASEVHTRSFRDFLQCS